MDNQKKQYYSPQFSELAAVSVRRLAWAMDMPMTSTIDLMVRLIPSVVDAGKVCLACKDRSKCQNCGFRNPSTPQEAIAILAAV